MDYLKTKKSLGQHWLYDPSALSAMVELAEIKAGDEVVEVGPGLGTLTEYILKTGANVTAVEFDQELYEKLTKQKPKLFGRYAVNLKLVSQDILKFRFDQLPKGYKVAANIPYYLTSNLIRVLSETTNQPSSVTLLIQKEVAERLCAGPGDMSLLSVWAQVYFECSLGPVVPARLFTPPPKVDSQIVVMKLRSTPLFAGTDKKLLSQVIKAGFSNKRKTLHNSLSAGLQISKDSAKEILEQANISVAARPQELSLVQWINLANSWQSLRRMNN